MRIERITRELVVGETVDRRPLQALPGPRITICAALLRPQRFSFMVER